jgi:hypothetical protein
VIKSNRSCQAGISKVGREALTEAGALKAKDQRTGVCGHEGAWWGTHHDAAPDQERAEEQGNRERREALTAAEEQQALASMIKQRRKPIDQFTMGDRPEPAARQAAQRFWSSRSFCPT